ncbi:MAG: hypothetical protein L0H59_05900, partial [Tomitella sp.]|nr:hypothetical protein [Tomitella sp.]
QAGGPGEDVVGERLATVPGGLTAAALLADATGARLAWIPRRAGERGSVEAGALPTLLPGGRRGSDIAARRQVAEMWGARDLPEGAGRDTDGIVAAAGGGRLGGLLVGGVELDDIPAARRAREAIEACGFVVSIEQRRSAVTDAADVVLPVASVEGKSGTFLDWEGRGRVFDAALPEPGTLPDLRILHMLAGRMGVDLGLPDVASARAEMARLGTAGTEDGRAQVGHTQEELRARRGDGSAEPRMPAPSAAQPSAGPSGPSGSSEPSAGEAVLASWRMLLDDGRMQDGRPNLAATARSPVVRLAVGTAAEAGAQDGEPVTVSTDAGSVTLPLAITEMPERTVWVPMNSPGSALYPALGVTPGHVVTVRAGGDLR